MGPKTSVVPLFVGKIVKMGDLGGALPTLVASSLSLGSSEPGNKRGSRVAIALQDFFRLWGVMSWDSRSFSALFSSVGERGGVSRWLLCGQGSMP